MKLLVRGKLDTFFLCLCLGITYQVLCRCTALCLIFFVPISPAGRRYFIGETLSTVPLCVVYGIPTGVVWSLFAVPLLRRRPLDRAVRVLLPVAAGLALVTTAIGLFALLGNPFAPTITWVIRNAAFVVACLFPWHKVPGTPAWLCRECGGRVLASGICSHCGDGLLYERRAVQCRLLGGAGLTIAAGLLLVGVATREGSCGLDNVPGMLASGRERSSRRTDGAPVGTFWRATASIPWWD
jgi:hypothetical protein